MKKNEIFKKKLEMFILFCLVVFSCQYVTEYYIALNKISKTFIYFNTLLALLFPIVGLLFQKYNFKDFLNNKYNIYYVFLFAFILIITVIYFIFSERKSRDIVCLAIYIQIITAYIYKKLTLEFLEKFFKVLSIIAFIGFVYAINNINFNLEFAINRGYQYKEIFYYTILFWASIPFVISSFLQKKNIIWSLIYLVQYIIINLIIVKRMILVQIGVLSLIIFLMLTIQKKEYKIIFKITVLILIILLIGYCTQGEKLEFLFKDIYERTMEESSKLKEFSRLIESKIYLQQESSFFDLMIGKGFGGVQNGLGTEAEALHIGWGNFILKGGILLLLLAVTPYFKMIFLLKNLKNLSLKKQFSFWYLLYCLPMLFLLNFHTFAPQMFLFWFCCLEIMKKEKKVIMI